MGGGAAGRPMSKGHGIALSGLITKGFGGAAGRSFPKGYAFKLAGGSSRASGLKTLSARPQSKQYYSLFAKKVMATATATTDIAATVRSSTTSVAITTGPPVISTYHSITNAQHVDGHWSKTSVASFLSDGQKAALDALSEKENTKYTIAALVLLREKFDAESGDWKQSSVKAWQYIEREEKISSRMAASRMVRDVLSALGSSVSVFSVIA